MRWMTWRATSRQVIGCTLTQETRVQSALDDVASDIRQALLYLPNEASSREGVG